MGKRNKHLENETKMLCNFSRELNKKAQEEKKKDWKIRQAEMRKKGIILQNWQDPLPPEEEREKFLQSIEKPGTMSNGEATILWLVAMVVSLFFKGGWMMCVLLTIAWFKHITR